MLIKPQMAESLNSFLSTPPLCISIIINSMLYIPIINLISFMLHHDALCVHPRCDMIRRNENIFFIYRS